MSESGVQGFERERIPSLDGVRAFSIVCVLWGHASATRGFPIRWSPDSNLGVRIFFVISGFIITHLMLQEEQARGTVWLKGFYRRRAARILPVYWVYLLFIVVLGWCDVLQVNFAGDILRPLTFSLGLSFWPKNIAWQTAHTWSLAIEEQFYLIWPPMFVLLRRRGRLVFTLLIVIAGPIARSFVYFHPRQWGLNWTIVGNADMLAWGCLLALVRADSPTWLTKILRWRTPVARLIALVVIQFAPWYFWKSFVRKYPPLSTNVLSYSAQAAGVTFLIASLVQIRQGLLFRLLNLRVFAALGVLSYGLYLWQEPFLDRSNSLGVLNKWPINMICVFAVAIASYFVIERPLRAMLRGPKGQTSSVD